MDHGVVNQVKANPRVVALSLDTWKKCTQTNRAVHLMESGPIPQFWGSIGWIMRLSISYQSSSSSSPPSYDFFDKEEKADELKKQSVLLMGGVGLEPAPSGFWRLLLYLVSHAPHLHCPPLLSHPPPFASSTIYTSAFLCGVTANTNIKKNKKTKNRYFNNLLIFIDNHKISFIHPSFLFGTKLALPKALVTDQMTILPLKVQFCPGVVLVKGSGH